MEQNGKKMPASEMEHENIVFTRNLKAGRRIYYFDVKKSANGDFFVSITESQKQESNVAGNAAAFKRHKIFLYKEDFDSFLAELNKAIDYAKESLGNRIITRGEYESKKKYLSSYED